MPSVNRNYKNVNESYLFSTIAQKVSEYSAKNPDKKVIKMGIGDVTLPLCPAVVSAMEKACAEMGQKATFRGYGPEQGYGFLREAVARYYFKRGVSLKTNEIFISDGAKSDIANITDLFSNDNTILIPDPVYPVYVDSNLMLGRKIIYIKSSAENGFLPSPPDFKADIVYLCSPNNPTGAVFDKKGLSEWVDYCLKQKAVLLFDSAYESYVSDSKLPRSIYEIEGARECAIEFCSLSKTAGFTGTRCGYTLVPEELVFGGMSLNKMWLRRQTTKFNGVPYIVQRGAEAVFSEEGNAQVREMISYYMENARILSDALSEKGVTFTGGINSPYIWLKCPKGMTSWEFFDYLLERACVVGTPGSGFGDAGEGYFRLTAFSDRESTLEAAKRIKGLL